MQNSTLIGMLCVAMALLAWPDAARGALMHKEPLKVGRDITVLADPSLTVPLSMIARNYAREHSVPVTTSFTSSHDQIEAISQGIEEGDLFIAAKSGWVKSLQQQGLIDVYSRSYVTRNALSLVGPRGYHAPENISDDQLLKLLPPRDEEFQFAIGDAEFMAEGTYALESLSALGLATDLEPFYSVLSDSMTLARAVGRHGAFGTMFRSDALLFPGVRELRTLPEGSHEPIFYQAVVIAGENMEGARKFLAYLRSEPAQAVFQQYGFAPVGEKVTAVQ